MDKETLSSILDDIYYRPGWDLNIDQKGDNLFVYASFEDGGEIQKSRKWYISPYMTKSEVVQTILALILLAEEHEVRERFRYKGRRIFGPHFDADVMVDIAAKKMNLDIREPV